MSEYKYFGSLTKQEQNELKTAHLLGLTIENCWIDHAYPSPDEYWTTVNNPSWKNFSIYRVKPND